MRALVAIVSFVALINATPPQDSVRVGTLRVDTAWLDTVLIRSYEQRRATTVRKANILQGDLNDIGAKLDSILKILEEK